MQLRLDLNCEVIPIKDYVTPEVVRHLRVGLAKKLVLELVGTFGYNAQIGIPE